MRRHLDDHPNISSGRVYGSASLPLSSTSLSNSSSRPVAADIDARVGSLSSGIPVTTAGSSTTASLSLHNQGRTNSTLSPGVSPGGSKPSVQRQPLALIQETVHSVGSGNSVEMQSGVQFPLSSGFQSRVAAATTLASHSLQNPSGVHHSPHPVQQQAHTPLGHLTPTNSQGQQQMHFQRLKVEDALSYLDQVKYKFGNQPQVYNDFLDIMKEFKSQTIDTPGVIQRVSNLFRGHSELIVGFNTFLPLGFRIEVQSNEQVQVSIPGTTTGSGTTGPTSLTIHPGGITSSPSVPSHNTQHNSISHPTSPHQSSSANMSSKVLNHQTPITNSQSHQNSQNTLSYNQNSPVHNSQTGSAPASVHSPNSAPPANQPVEFNHAINYVNKIKNRFQGQPDIYKQFLEILHTYQKEQRNIKDGIQTSTKPLTEVEVYAQVAQLFQNQEDLLQEFGQFLPDANGANALAAFQPHKAVNNDHTAATKKPVLPSKPPVSPASTPSKPVQSIKRPASSSGPSPAVKKPKMTSLKDVTLAEAGKYGTLNEYAFFDKVRKALRSQDVYENFLRCLILYNQEIISRADLVQLIAPFLSKYYDLFKWFKDFLGYKENNNNVETVPNKVATQERERVGDFAMEIDYSSCKKYGASYRAVPRNYVQPKCSGRDAKCREVLNDTWVSFPSWSEDSTFVSSRKTQYEEYIYRCEDERFELDVVLENNLATIQVLEFVQEKMNRMSVEEKVKFRLDDTLGGSSTVLHQRAIKRLYGDKGPDVIEGLKKNPAVAVPLVLKRLKFKEEEWRKQQKSFNKHWKEQNEKYYLKSLDYQGLTFKQNDIKYLRSKSILNEIETISEERHEQAEDGGEVTVGPHMVCVYTNKAVLKDAANLIIHHVKRQTGIHKEDKQKIKQLMRQFIPDLFSVPRGELSDDEIDKDEDMDDENSKTSACHDLLSLKMGHRNLNYSFEGSILKSDSMSSVNDRNSEKVQAAHNISITQMENSIPDDSYALMFVNNNWFCFYRMHYILCERLTKMYERAQILLEEEQRNQEEKKKSTALALRLKTKSGINIESYYTTLLDMVKSLLDGNIESSQYEDTLREMFGIHAYLVFTLDKVVQNAVRQLQHIVGDDNCTKCTALFLEEQKNKATGGPCSTASQRATAEYAYQKRAEQIDSSENCFKLIIYKNEGKMTIELLDNFSEPSEDQGDADKWPNYFGNYTSVDDGIPNELKEQFSKRPVFLPRNVRSRRSRNQLEEKACERNLNNALENIHDDIDGKIDLSRLEDGNAGEAVKGLVGLNAKALLMDRGRNKNTDNIDVHGRSECKFNVNSFKMLFVLHNESCLYKRMALKKAHQSHRKVSEKLSKRFKQWHKRWLNDNVSEEQSKRCHNWLLGLVEDNIPTSCIKIENPSKAPYTAYNCYKVRDRT